MFWNKQVPGEQSQDSRIFMEMKKEMDRLLKDEIQTVSFAPSAKPLEEAVNALTARKCPNHIGVIREVNDVVLSMMKMDFVKDMIRDVEHQMEMVEIIAASSEESAASITEVSGFVRDSAVQSAAVGDLTAAGMEGASHAISLINQSFQETGEAKARIQEVSQKTREIDNMVSIIKSVADQTNLLALNASIEAARAGEAGRGFAVVADEIKKLADNTKDSVDIIIQSVNSLRQDIDRSVKSVEQASETFSAGRSAMERLAVDMEKIDASVQSIRGNMEQVAANIDQQSAASQEIASNLSTINENTHSLHTKCNMTGKGIYDLSVAFDAVRKKLLSGNAEISDRDAVSLCIVDHLNWRWRIYNMILGYDKIDSTMVGNHTTCRLGRWISTRWQDKPNLKSYIQKIEAPHKHLHELALSAVNAYNGGRVTEAEKDLVQMDTVSKDIVKLLTELQTKEF